MTDRLRRMMRIAAFTACAGLAGAASPVAAGLFSATGRVIAIVAGELFVGEAEGHLDGAGKLAIRSQKDPALTCRGEFTSSAALGGAGQMRCSDGASASFRFQRMSVFSGHGHGSTSRGTMSFTYGLDAAESVAYLKPPEGKKLDRDGVGLKLVDL